MHQRFAALLLLLVLVLPVFPAASQDGSTLTVVTHDSFNYSDAVMEQFQQESGITVEVLRAGDAGAMLNQSILSRENPLGDVMFGVDNTFLGRALDNDLFIPYESPNLEGIPEDFIVDAEHRVTPIDYGDVCLNYDVAYFEENDLELPDSLAALTQPEYSGMLVVENPATSSPGLAFLLATVATFGTEGDYTYLDFWADLVANDVLVVDGWEAAYYGAFSLYAEDDPRPLVVGYANNPPVEVYYADPTPETAPTGAIVADGTCFRQIEFAGILNGTDNLEGAQQFIDFLLSVPFQEDMPLNMFVFPVNPDAELPEIFTEYAAVPENPAVLSSDDINTHRDEWIEAWTEVVMQQ
ncbi:MAG: thiamine ABC transporter substrate-binding protein [Anaerolineae bacterium]